MLEVDEFVHRTTHYTTSSVSYYFADSLFCIRTSVCCIATAKDECQFCEPACLLHTFIRERRASTSTFYLRTLRSISACLQHDFQRQASIEAELFAASIEPCYRHNAGHILEDPCHVQKSLAVTMQNAQTIRLRKRIISSGRKDMESHNTVLRSTRRQMGGV